MKNLHCVPKSQNSKIGECAATYRPVGITCPSECPLLDDGCYAQRGHTNIQQLKSQSYDDELNKLEEASYIRHHVTGDFFINDELDVDYLHSVLDFHWRHPTIEGWSYTHRWEDIDEVAPLEIHPKNMTILASVDSIREKKLANSFGWRTARVTDSLEKEDDELFCPIDLAKHKGKKAAEISTNCIGCQLCWKSDKNIVFLKV